MHVEFAAKLRQNSVQCSMSTLAQGAAGGQRLRWPCAWRPPASALTQVDLLPLCGAHHHRFHACRVKALQHLMYLPSRVSPAIPPQHHVASSKQCRSARTACAGGSCRIPASVTGVLGFRPTTGCWAAGDGIVPMSVTRDTVGAHASLLPCPSWDRLKGCKFGIMHVTVDPAITPHIFANLADLCKIGQIKMHTALCGSSRSFFAQVLRKRLQHCLLVTHVHVVMMWQVSMRAL
jgi:hypothetical protein